MSALPAKPSHPKSQPYSPGGPLMPATHYSLPVTQSSVLSSQSSALRKARRAMLKLRILLSALILTSFLLLPARPAPAQAAGDFVTVQGGQIVFKGQPVKLKGVNFYPKDQPWGDMWRRWDGEATRQDLARVRDLGA